MTELCDFQGEALLHYRRKVMERCFIVALFKLELITSSQLVSMGNISWLRVGRLYV